MVFNQNIIRHRTTFRVMADPQHPHHHHPVAIPQALLLKFLEETVWPWLWPFFWDAVWHLLYASQQQHLGEMLGLVSQAR